MDMSVIIQLADLCIKEIYKDIETYKVRLNTVKQTTHVVLETLRNSLVYILPRCLSL